MNPLFALLLCLPAAPQELVWDARAVEHLYNRAGFGARPAEIAAGVAMGQAALVELLLKGTGAEAEPFFVEEFLRTPGVLVTDRDLDREERMALIAEYRRRDQRQIVDFAAWWIDAMRVGGHPLQERMTLFWHGFFTSSMRDVKSSVAMIRQNKLFRRHGLGSYADLLSAMVHDPALLVYLNNNQNRRGRPNENLARELFELFSLGEGNYTEDDVKEAARALTGWHVFAGRFRVAFRLHDRGQKTILGETGAFDGDDLPRILLKQPACARHLAGELLTHFEGLAPATERLETYAAFLREHDYRIDLFLEQLFLDPAFYREEAVGTRIAGPLEYLVGTARRLGVKPPPLVLASGASLLGQRLFDPPSVKGWDEGQAWISTSSFLLRGNLAGILLGVVAPSELVSETVDEELALVETEDAESPESMEGEEPSMTEMDDENEPEMDEQAPAEPRRTARRRSPEHEVLRALERAGWRPQILLRDEVARAGAQTDEEIVAFLCDELLGVPVSLETRAPLVAYLAAERAALTEDSGADLSNERPARRLQRFYTPETGEEHALRRLAHVILSLPEAQLN